MARRAEPLGPAKSAPRPERVAAFLGLEDSSNVIRYELPNLGALNFIVRGILANTLRVDAQGKTLGQVLLNFPL